MARYNISPAALTSIRTMTQARISMKFIAVAPGY